MLPDKTEKAIIAITTDDLCPRNIKMWDIMDEFKKEFPHFKVTAFTIPRFKDLDSEDLSNEAIFKFEDWLLNRLDWVEIALHGYTHGWPPECLRWKEYQVDMIKKSIEALKPFLPKHVGLRPPGSNFNEFTKQACIELDLSYLAPSDRLIPLKPTKAIKCDLINSHLSKNNADSLDLVKKDLSELIAKSECITLSEIFV